MKVAFIGGGNMGVAIIGGLLARGFRPGQFHVVDPNVEQRRHLADGLGVACSAACDAVLSDHDVIMLAVKPQQMREAAAQLRPHLKAQLVLTIAAGIRLADLQRWLGGHANLVRAMPNTPALIHQGMTGLYAAPGVAQAARDAADTLLAAVGETLWFDREELLDAVTAVSGSGPAYVFYFIEALQEAAIGLGFTAADARSLALRTFTGAAALAAGSAEPPATLRARVTSKAGTTERALDSMQDAHVKDLIIKAVQAAEARSRELGVELGRDA